MYVYDNMGCLKQMIGSKQVSLYSWASGRRAFPSPSLPKTLEASPKLLQTQPKASQTILKHPKASQSAPERNFVQIQRNRVLSAYFARWFRKNTLDKT